VSTDDTPIENDDAENTTSDKEKPADRFAKDLSDGLHDLGKFATGVAGKVLGPKADLANEEDPERTVVTPEIDDAIEKAGAAVGHFLRAAGEGFKENPAEPAEAVDATREKARKKAETAPDEDGWSPLVQGAKVFGEGVGAVAGELFDTLADEVSRKKKPATTAQAGEE